MHCRTTGSWGSYMPTRGLLLHVPRHEEAVLWHGVNPTVIELDQDPRGRDTKGFDKAAGYLPAVPVVFHWGQAVGMDRVMASHINGTLDPLLKQAGALWL
ncbi:Glutaredoxin-C3 [Hibiscus syriacus]|uniref:Glutaredoxin-C3 n=1 Tax=Hibiscus syriacus TaxID=106335 RepID=A0A6A3B463_HIBSY|nr:Glutaredoxin-C3 [Hibiscus syriacus]